ncbi:L7Ae/L30e/S12e/Gadd45 family ribosomal protein [Alkaliphilus oremlandii]|uniref:Ribosomal protein L7Ae/L30e/S12e/Gadd45 n=1 Tax=Alkaliphilus oremlandii (strain OhILAs) TaxID=350688 RepID=A8MFA7_ALKOO|nr:ribosomal L7Ae/L30e/S12e/Gadd45 family protein [Alkaliphilus oremlandii]ABW19070.1 ribosomal protein L7Ae/L30e/S12e/Gadd45 [Alkaliphilus oremlandii OhILAs]
MNDKIKNLVTLAAKSGNLVSGDETCMNSLKNGAIHLLILAEDASENTKKKFMDKASYRDVPIRIWKDKNELGSIIGKDSRTIVGIIDPGFAEKILSMF